MLSTCAPVSRDQATGPTSVGAAVQDAPADPKSAAANAASDTRTEKQKALARQTERLFDMASELKVEVDKTNKNILSLKVVQKAEQIESLAKGIKAQTKK